MEQAQDKLVPTIIYVIAVINRHSLTRQKKIATCHVSTKVQTPLSETLLTVTKHHLRLLPQM